MSHVSSLKPAQDPWQLIHSGEGCAFNPHGLKQKKMERRKKMESDKSLPLVNTHNMTPHLVLKSEPLPDSHTMVIPESDLQSSPEPLKHKPMSYHTITLHSAAE